MEKEAIFFKENLLEKKLEVQGLGGNKMEKKDTLKDQKELWAEGDLIEALFEKDLQMAVEEKIRRGEEIDRKKLEVLWKEKKDTQGLNTRNRKIYQRWLDRGWLNQNEKEKIGEVYIQDNEVDELIRKINEKMKSLKLKGEKEIKKVCQKIKGRIENLDIQLSGEEMEWQVPRFSDS